MKSVKQTTLRQSTDQYLITLIESKRFTTKQRRPRLALDGYKKNRPSEASATSEDVKQKQNERTRHRLLI